ncbi:hypothetical protein GDO78_003915 [Eleutherodactylus coqui]|uniref:Uncharacterized protein n=1 Tax=Eleutherodactylus coqui TaxID=57060 RepID=A0A8J6EVZ7_ELECQ|nr:hypothetical protein GDO78_003915 [Eleutherodactylus coqui]
MLYTIGERCIIARAEPGGIYGQTAPLLSVGSWQLIPLNEKRSCSTKHSLRRVEPILERTSQPIFLFASKFSLKPNSIQNLTIDFLLIKPNIIPPPFNETVPLLFCCRKQTPQYIA